MVMFNEAHSAHILIYKEVMEVYVMRVYIRPGLHDGSQNMKSGPLPINYQCECGCITPIQYWVTYIVQYKQINTRHH